MPESSPLSNPDRLRYATDEHELVLPTQDEVSRTLNDALEMTLQGLQRLTLSWDPGAPQSARFDSNKAGRIERKSPQKAAWLRLLAVLTWPECTDALIDLQDLAADLPPDQRLARARTIYGLAQAEWNRQPFLWHASSGLTPSGPLSPYIRASWNLRSALEDQNPDDPEAEALLIQETTLIAEHAPDVQQESVYAQLCARFITRADWVAAEEVLTRCAALDQAWFRLLLALIRSEVGAEDLLRHACERNRFLLPLILTGTAAPPVRSGTTGSRAEAAEHARPLNHAWQAHPRALGWLNEQPIGQYLLREHRKHQAEQGKDGR